MINSQYDICTTGTKVKAQKINLYFQDHITNLKKFKMSIFPWARIDELKKQLAATRYKQNIHWKDLRFFHKNLQLQKNNRRLFDCNVQPDGTIVIMAQAHNLDNSLGIVNPYDIFTITPQQITSLLMNVKSGLNNGQLPKLTPQGTSGTYFLENHLRKKVAIFKPFDEQPFTPNNPRNYIGKLGDCGIRKGILSGQSATRQVAAYLLDKQRFHGVPATTYIQFYHPIFSHRQIIENQPILSHKQANLKLINTKHGSLQQFVQSHDVAGNLSPKMFDVQQVHKIAILDLRILNCDRNQANILVRKMALIQKDKSIKSKYMKLIPIDHGLSFPDILEIYDYQLVWMNYPQVLHPLSQISLNFIANINPIQDCKKLRDKLGFRQICLRNFRIAQTFLKKTAAAGFNLKEIGNMVYRRQQDQSDCQDNDSKKSIQSKKDISELEKIVKQAQSIYFLVKQNGIKSTIQFQIGLIKPRQSQLPIINEQEQIKSPRRHLKKVKFQQPSIDRKTPKRQSNTITQRVRNVSLPHLKKQMNSQKAKLKKRRKKEGPNGINKISRVNLQWQQIFFHYFQDLLDRFISEKLKNNKKTRNRLLSQNLDDM